MIPDYFLASNRMHGGLLPEGSRMDARCNTHRVGAGFRHVDPVQHCLVNWSILLQVSILCWQEIERFGWEIHQSVRPGGGSLNRGSHEDLGIGIIMAPNAATIDQERVKAGKGRFSNYGSSSVQRVSDIYPFGFKETPLYCMFARSGRSSLNPLHQRILSSYFDDQRCCRR